MKIRAIVRLWIFTQGQWVIKHFGRGITDQLMQQMGPRPTLTFQILYARLKIGWIINSIKFLKFNYFISSKNIYEIYFFIFFNFNLLRIKKQVQ